jgi:hypothetical protein
MTVDIEQFSQRLRDRLMPKSYQRDLRVDGDSPSLLLVSGRLLGRYALALFPWDGSRDGVSQLKAARRAVANRLLAFPIFGEVGLYLVFVGSEAAWAKHASSLQADSIGLHRVIVQAVHFVDLSTGRTRLNRSAWGPIHFGGVDSVAPIVSGALV